jgi:holin, phage phi LC3 family
MINWKIRFKNPLFVTAFISQVLVVVAIIVQGGHAVGLWSFTWTDAINQWIQALVGAVLVALSSLGIVQDPTTNGLSDSQQEQGYTEPKK